MPSVIANFKKIRNLEHTPMRKPRLEGVRSALLLAATLLFLAFPPRLLADPSTFYNVLLPNGADPWVVRHSDGYYYMTVSTGGSVRLWRSRSLTGLGGGQQRVAWTPPAAGPSSKHLWAPELHHVGGKWYIYVAADDGRSEHHRMYVLENANADPFQGEFVLKGKVFDPRADRWAIDGTLLNVRDRLFFIWSGWEGDEDIRQVLYIAPMSDPLRLSGPRVEIARPQFAWEKAGSDRQRARPEVNEGPEVLIRSNLVHVVFSASGSWTDDYCLGILTARLDADLLSPAAWTKSPHPVFQRARGVPGPGHCSFVKSPSGAEDWIVYHAARYPGSEWNRLVRAQRFSWRTDGLPDFGAPADPNRPIPLPAGDPPHARYEAERARLGGAATILPSPEASGKAKVGSLETPDSFVEFRVTAAAAGTHILAVRFGTGTRRGASHKVSVNEAAAGEVAYPYSGWDHWSNAFLSVELKQGENTVRFTRGAGFGEIDCLDVFAVLK
jgi:GH43 family beta-xylosidase